MNDEAACRKHKDIDCKVCDKYQVDIELFPDKKHSTTFWVGQDITMEWGPMGMSDYAVLRFIPGEK